MPEQPQGSPPASIEGPRRWREQPAAATSVSDYVHDLLWPRVLRSAAYGLRAGRLGLAFFAVVLSSVLLGIGLWLDRQIGWGTADAGVASGASWAWRWFVAFPVALVRAFPLTVLLVGPLVLVVWQTMLGAVARIAACEIAQGRFVSWHEGLTFAAARWKHIVAAVLGPLALVWLLIVLIALGGWLLLNWPWLSALGGILYVVPLALGLVIAALLAVYAVGHTLFIPAIVCEGSDAIDALQRAYAYVLARPVRLVMYLALALAGLIVTVGLVGLVAFWGIDVAARASTLWTGNRGTAMVWRGSASAVYDVASGLGSPWSPSMPSAPLEVPAAGDDVSDLGKQPAGYRPGAALVRFWTLIPLLMLIASWMSCGMAAMTMVYLSMRRVCDGQDIAEIWWPGAIEASMSSSMGARAEAAKQAGLQAPQAPLALGDADEA